MHRRILPFAALAACAIAVPVAVATAAAPPHPHPLITDVAGDARTGPLRPNNDVDIVSADVTTDGTTISFTVKTAAPTPLIGGGTPVSAVSFVRPDGLSVGSYASGGQATINTGSCGFGETDCEFPTDYISGTVSVSRSAATTTATYSLADLNDLYARDFHAAPLTPASVLTNATARATKEASGSPVDVAGPSAAFTLGG